MNEAQKEQLEGVMDYAVRCWRNSDDDKATSDHAQAYVSGLIALQLDRIATSLEAIMPEDEPKQEK